MCFFNNALKTQDVYAYLERTVSGWELPNALPGIVRYAERKDENYKILPCAQLDKNVCTYSFWSNADGLELTFKITYDRKKKTVYICVDFKGLDFYRLQETQEKLKNNYPKFAFAFNRESTEICYSESSKMQYMDAVETVCWHFVDEWKECGLYDELLDYYNLFK